MAFSPKSIFKLFVIFIITGTTQAYGTRAFDVLSSRTKALPVRQYQLHNMRALERRNSLQLLPFSRSKEFSAIRLSKRDESKEKDLMEEEVNRKVWDSRRKYIRSVLRFAESVKYYRISNGLLDVADDGRPDAEKKDSDRKFALALTAFVAAAGAVLLRVGGRAALISSLGLDFSSQNPEMKEQLDSFLAYVQESGPYGPLLFILAWTAVKVFCFDAGGLVLAFASVFAIYILPLQFGGVLQGALFSAFAATVGSSVAFVLAKLDTPLRKQALQLIEKYPSLRGVEKVVAKDGVKAVLTLRLAPILPIPIGAYNYVYGVTNVSYVDFSTGIFLGSIKPYLLDSYLGYFGKNIIDGSSSESFTEDFTLILALCVSVLIGVFASQLAGETWESVQKEIELEKASRFNETDVNLVDGLEKGILKDFLGVKLPTSLIDLQRSFHQASQKVAMVVHDEYHAKLWNNTQSKDSYDSYPNPVIHANSPERIDKGFDIGQSIVEGLVLTPVLFSAAVDFANPLFNDESPKSMPHPVVNNLNDTTNQKKEIDSFLKESKSSISDDFDRNFIILRDFRSQLEKKLKEIDSRML